MPAAALLLFSELSFQQANLQTGLCAGQVGAKVGNILF